MAHVKQLDKRSGITYVYESKAHWDKEKCQSRAVRTLIGRLDPKTGEVVKTDGRGKRRRDMFPEESARHIDVSIISEVEAKLKAFRYDRRMSVRTALVYDGDLVASVPASRFFDFLIPARELFFGERETRAESSFG